MTWQKNISEGFYRTALVLSSIAAVLTFLIFVIGNGNLFYGILISGVIFAVVFGLVAIINYIVRGFVG
jgi:hypothetical protein